MRGVERGNQLIGYYNLGRRSRKWRKRMFSHVIEISALNSYILDKYAKPLEHAVRGHKKTDYLQFRLELAEQLIGAFNSWKRAGRPRYSKSIAKARGWTLASSSRQEAGMCCV